MKTIDEAESAQEAVKQLQSQSKVSNNITNSNAIPIATL